MIDIKIKKPPMIVLLLGISLIPKIGTQTQKIPPITSVKDNKVSSAAGRFFDPIEYKIKPRQTIVPWSANKLSFLLDEKKFWSLISKSINEKTKQKKPEKATVVNLGVSFLHLKETEKIENPTAELKPKNKPVNVPIDWLP